MILALWIVVGLLAGAGMVLVAWPVDEKPKLAPAPARDGGVAHPRRGRPTG